MSTAVKKERATPDKLDQQIRRAKAVLRELKATLEDLEDNRENAVAKKRNAGRATVSLRDAAKDLGL